MTRSMCQAQAFCVCQTARLDTLDMTSSTKSTRQMCQAHAFWLCRACQTAQLNTTSSTGSTSDISDSKINSVSITVLRIIGSFKFLLYFCFGKLFVLVSVLNHFYFSFYFRFRVYYVEDEINSTNVTTTGCSKISIPQRFLQFSAVTWNFKAKFYQHINILFILCTHNVF